MSVKYIPVQWNRNKWIYDGFMLAGVVGFLTVFLYLSPELLSHKRPINPQVHNARAFGACTFMMLSIILAIGPLARLDRRFLPLLYNRRHFGVMTAAVALTHFGYILNWYFAFSSSNKYEALLFANTSYTQASGFPFEAFGLLALMCLLILAATSHDFWLKFLTAPVWKRIHYLIYVAYASVVAHVSLGILQDQKNQLFTWIFIITALVVAGLHLAAFLHERRAGDPVGNPDEQGWIAICEAEDIPEARARIAVLPDGDRVAVFRMENKLSAISNACAHQNGPLGEGKIIRCLVTCPWHGFQYDVRSGRSPAPFTETIPTYRLTVRDGTVWVDPAANPPGTYVEPVEVPA
ncbi:Rieske 2Fe-2S domain-containing protein [Ruegeria sp. HKCCD8929]|uniref:Rieske 2Fe-2S domain-containing protein n=1 Tax=Ruegeria sp. HKCCD8929 TaxID=2683006 RepID=UPI00148809F5|nr:Rieske 2Fe-2S domain-containing protein [Ruegeria sp. HKCCD8929]